MNSTISDYCTATLQHFEEESLTKVQARKIAIPSHGHRRDNIGNIFQVCTLKPLNIWWQDYQENYNQCFLKSFFFIAGLYPNSSLSKANVCLYEGSSLLSRNHALGRVMVDRQRSSELLLCERSQLYVICTNTYIVLGIYTALLGLAC